MAVITHLNPKQTGENTSSVYAWKFLWVKFVLNFTSGKNFGFIITFKNNDVQSSNNIILIKRKMTNICHAKTRALGANHKYHEFDLELSF